MTDFDMPPAGAGFEARGGWVATHLAAELGLTIEQAAGIVGNPGYESGGFKELQELSPLVEGSRGGYGWSQWTGPRRRAFESWCAGQRLDPASDRANYGYILVELKGDYAYCVNAVRREPTIERCVFVFGRLYEAPAGTTATHLPGYEERLGYARRALAGAKGLKPAAATASAPPAAAVPAPSKPTPAPVDHATAPAAEADNPDSEAYAEDLNRKSLEGAPD